MPRIAISYRREDSEIITDRICDRLRAHYGRDSVFVDIDDIPPGADFRAYIGDVLDASDVVLAIVGPKWVGPRPTQNRLADPADPVRLEIEAVLRKGKPLIPVLVLRARMPRIDQLPESLRELPYRHAVSIESREDFNTQTTRLINAIDRILGAPSETLPPPDAPPPEPPPAIEVVPPPTDPELETEEAGETNIVRADPAGPRRSTLPRAALALLALALMAVSFVAGQYAFAPAPPVARPADESKLADQVKALQADLAATQTAAKTAQATSAAAEERNRALQADLAAARDRPPAVQRAGAQAATLDKVKAAGSFTCGVPTGIAGFAQPDARGVYGGFDIDICRAMSAAIFGDPGKVKYVPLTPQQRFTALQSGEVDILSNNTARTLSRDADLGLSFGPVVFYDGQGFMLPRALTVKSARELSGATICVQPGTTTELNLADYFRASKMEYKPVVIEKLDELYAAFFSGRCDAITTDSSTLAVLRATKTSKPDDYVILPERVSLEPLAPVVRHGDEQWRSLVDWVVYALMQGEAMGITRANVDDMAKSDDPNVRRLLGVAPGAGKALGLDERWAYNAIKAVGNYGEMFERNLGAGSPLKLDRGLNALWTSGGLIYPMPIR